MWVRPPSGRTCRQLRSPPFPADSRDDVPVRRVRRRSRAPSSRLRTPCVSCVTPPVEFFAVPGPTGSDHDVTMAPSPTPGTATTPLATGTGRFAPGSIVAGRYRLVALLGRGGMGEVYRADDLTLDQPVALKFLPDGTAADPARLAQFHN